MQRIRKPVGGKGSNQTIIELRHEYFVEKIPYRGYRSNQTIIELRLSGGWGFESLSRK